MLTQSECPFSMFSEVSGIGQMNPRVVKWKADAKDDRADNQIEEHREQRDKSDDEARVKARVRCGRDAHYPPLLNIGMKDCFPDSRTSPELNQRCRRSQGPDSALRISVQPPGWSSRRQMAVRGIGVRKRENILVDCGRSLRRPR